MSRHTRQRGFSLLELLIVVCIIGIIAAIAVPSLRGARLAAQKGATLANLQTMLKSEISLRISTGRFARMSELNQFYNGALGIPSGGGTSLTRQGFVYQTLPTTPTDPQLKDTFTITATGPGPDGITPYVFQLDQSGVISQIQP